MNNQKSQLHELVYDYCLNSNETNPIKLYDKIVCMDEMPIHGPIHHFIITAVLFTCYDNKLGNSRIIRQKHLENSFEKSNIVPGAFCANFGACGAGLGVGIFFSILTNNSPLSEDSWSKVITVSSEAQILIAKHGGPRCCKRDSYLALISAIKSAKEILTVDFDTCDNIKCAFSNKNAQCRKDKCLFYTNDVK